MEWVAGGGDSYQHFLISKYSFQHPELFFNHWGKPMFTVLSSSFAQFGMKGIEFFNLFCALGSGYLAYLISVKLRYDHAWLALVFTLFAPVFYSHLFSALTEPLGALILLLALFFLIEEKFKLAVILFSVNLFVRNETIIFLPILALYLVLVGQFKRLIWFFVLPVVFSFLGAIHYGSLFWIVEQFPYRGAKEIYGVGALSHFLDSYDNITHLVISLALIIGLLSYFTKFKALLRLEKQVLFEWLLMSIGVGYLVAHSVSWWSGIGGSLGLARVLIPVIPVFAIIATKGVATLLFKLPEKPQHGLVVIIMCITIYIPIERYRFPVGTGDFEQLAQRVAADYKGTFDNKIVAFFHPTLAYYLELDPFIDENFDLVNNGTFPITLMRSGDILIWDSALGPNEGGTTLSDLPQFEVLKEYVDHAQNKMVVLKKRGD